MSSGRTPARKGAAPVRPERGHDISDHTADARIDAWATTLPALFEEAAAGLAALTVEIDGDTAPAWTPVELVAHDLDHLAFAWLNELIGLAEVEHRAVACARVTGIEAHDEADPTQRWHLRAGVALVDYAPGRVRALRHAKAATLHGLRVEELAGGWSVQAVVDL